MRQFTITVPPDVRSDGAGELQILVRDYGDEGTPHVTADCRPAPGAIWRPVDLLEEYIR